MRSLAVAEPPFGSSALVNIAKRIECPFASHKNPYGLARRLDGVALEVNEFQAAGCVIVVLGRGLCFMVKIV